jgi:hypothetical protein
MQTMKLADDLMPLARDGQKRVTVRNGRRAITPGEMIFEATDGTEPDLRVNVLTVVVVKLKDAPKWALKGEGLRSIQELLDVLLPYYPTVTLESEVTCIEFDALTEEVA